MWKLTFYFKLLFKYGNILSDGDYQPITVCIVNENADIRGKPRPLYSLFLSTSVSQQLCEQRETLTAVSLRGDVRCVVNTALISKVNRDNDSAQHLYKLEARTRNEPQANEIATLPSASHLSVAPPAFRL